VGDRSVYPSRLERLFCLPDVEESIVLALHRTLPHSLLYSSKDLPIWRSLKFKILILASQHIQVIGSIIDADKMYWLK
jgi:hypothetical protein